MKNSPDLHKKAKAELARRELARRHLKDFAEYVYDDYISGWHTETICEALDKVQRGEIRFLIIEAPPRHSKSLHVSQLFPAYAVGKNRDDSVIVSSYSGDLATDHGRETRNLMKTKRYENVFNTRLAPDSDAKGKWNTDGKGAYNAAGVGGSITGKGAQFFIVDDSLKDRKEAESILVRDNIWNWFRSVARTRLTPNGAMVVMGTRWHLDDLIGRLLQEDSWRDYFAEDDGSKWVRLKLTAVAERDEQFRKKDEPLWPERYPLKELESIKQDIGGYEWSALYQQNPVDEENRVFKPEWFKTRDINELEYVQTRNFLTIDTKATNAANAGSDYIGLTLNFVDRENNWHFMSRRMKLSSKELVDLIFNWHDKYNLDAIGMEKMAFTEGLEPYIEGEMRARNKFLPLVPLSHRQTKKELRIEQSLSPRYERGAIYHLTINGVNQCADLEEELLRFPVAVNDDASDSAAYQGDIAEPHAEMEDEELSVLSDLMV